MKPNDRLPAHNPDAVAILAAIPRGVPIQSSPYAPNRSHGQVPCKKRGRFGHYQKTCGRG